jgi:protein-S-isoprenylcysteine O-methyltransferase Ste14
MFIFKTVIWGSIFLLAALIVGPWLALQFDASFPQIHLGPFKYIGAVLFGIGFLFTVYCAFILFTPGKSRPAPYDAGGAFTIEGPYRYVRNPFMLGVVVALWGEAIFMERVLMMIYALIITWVIHFWVIFFEEPALEERFGGEYDEYRKAVPRWFPHFRRYEK